MLSIVIPTYNEERHIGQLLDSIYSNDYKENFEIIVVDDGSKDNTVKIIQSYEKVRLFKQNHKGAAAARNFGVKQSKGDIILFLDSDVITHKNVLSKIDIYFKKNPDLKVLMGIYSKNPVNKSLFTRYKALLDYYIFTSTSDKSITSFEPRCGAIKKEVFLEIGGFDTKYKGADIEDYEFGYRILKKYKMYIDQSIQVDHNFPDFKTNTKNFFKRGFMWIQLFLERKKFDNVGTTSGAAFGRGCAFLGLLLLPLIFISKLFLIFSLIFILIYFLYSLKLFFIILKEKNPILFIYSIFIDYFLCIVLGLAGIFAVIDYVVRRK